MLQIIRAFINPWCGNKPMRFFCRLLGRHLNSVGTNLPKVKNKESLEEEEEEEDCSLEILLTLKKEHRAKNKILGELNILSLSISES